MDILRCVDSEAEFKKGRQVQTLTYYTLTLTRDLSLAAPSLWEWLCVYELFSDRETSG